MGRLDKLLAMDFPGLDDLPLHEIATVRTGPEFSQLRRDLGQALDRVLGDAVTGGPEWGRVAKRQLSAELGDSRERFQRGISKSRVLGRAALKATKPFVLTFASIDTGVGLVLDAMGGDTLQEALTDGAMSGALVGALRTIGIVRAEYGEEWQRSQQALEAARRQVSVLSKPDPD